MSCCLDQLESVREQWIEKQTKRLTLVKLKKHLGERIIKA